MEKVFVSLQHKILKLTLSFWFGVVNCIMIGYKIELRLFF